MSDLPEPMVPAECDLRDFPFMPLDCARLLDSDLFALARGDEFKAAVALWCKSWGQVPTGSLPADEKVLAHLSGAGAAWKKVREMALRGWVKCSDGRLYHPVIAEKAAEGWAKKLAQRARGKRGNEVRWGAKQDDKTPPPTIPKGSPKDRAGNPSAILGQSQGTVRKKEEVTQQPLSSFPDSREPEPPRVTPTRTVQSRLVTANDPPEAWLHLADRNPDGSPKREAGLVGTDDHGRPLAGGYHLDVAARHVTDEANWRHDKPTDWSLLAEWLRAGCDLHDHILPVVRRLTASLRAKPGGDVAQSLRFFDGAIRDAAPKRRA